MVKVILVNPRIYYIGNSLSLGVPLDGDNQQIEEKIKKILISQSVICDKIEVNKKEFINSDKLKSAQELIDEVKDDNSD